MLHNGMKAHRALWMRPGLLLSLLGVGLFLVLGLFMLLRHRPQAVAYRYFQPYPDTLHYSGLPGSREDSLLVLAMGHYNSGQYEAAIPYFDQLAELGHHSREVACFYGGVAQLALNEPAKALAYFRRLPADKQASAPVQWYTALAELACGKVSRAKVQLQPLVADTSSLYWQQAHAAMQDMDCLLTGVFAKR
ncbi:MAG: hypothetical protein D6730_08450 [Bacteroidetes bacterium]|nr:MAG: hypothetical protein D6730_08450 [Bacteroidota bacterium]